MVQHTWLLSDHPPPRVRPEKAEAAPFSLSRRGRLRLIGEYMSTIELPATESVDESRDLFVQAATLLAALAPFAVERAIEKAQRAEKPALVETLRWLAQ